MGLTNAISQAIQLQLTAGEHILSGAPTASATKALLRLGNAITGGSANGTYFGTRLPTGFIGDLCRFEHADATSGPSLNGRAFTGGFVKFGFGKTPAAGDRRVSIQGVANDELDGGLTIINPTNGTAAGAVFGFGSGTGASQASGFIACYSAAYTVVPDWADRLVLGAASNASGLVIDANAATQDIRFRVGNLGEQMRLSSAGELQLFGTPQASATASLLRMGSAIVGGDADGTYIGINAANGYAGHFSRYQVNGADKCIIDQNGFISIGGATPNAGRPFNIQVNANAGFGLVFNNIFDGNAARSDIFCSVGTSSVASGGLDAWSPTFATASLAGRFGLVASTNDATTGLVFSANGATQNMTFAVGGLAEQMRLTASGELLIGTTSSLGRLAVVGRADQVQALVRGFSTQTNLNFRVENSAAALLFGIEGDGDIRTSRSVAATTPGAVQRKLELFDAAGSSIGFVPLYDGIT